MMGTGNLKNIFTTPRKIKRAGQLILLITLVVGNLVPTRATAAPMSRFTFTYIAIADTYVLEVSPGQNYGTSPYLKVDASSGTRAESFLQFSVDGISAPVQHATLRIYVPSNGTVDGPAVYGTSNSWTETGMTWNNRPGRTTAAIDNKGAIGVSSWVEYDVTSRVDADGTYSFILGADSNDGVTFSSRNGSTPPQLVITTSEPTTSSEVLVGAGDISSCVNSNDELTAQLLDNIPGTVFTLGDNAYLEGSYQQYTDCYGPTWGRHKARTKPVPGNHEYETAGANGYFQYFTGTPSYYAYDLGSWRIYALNSEIDISENSAQVTWLKNDLDANPRHCVLAYWHRPRWSSGTHHSTGENLQTLWKVLYDARAELVINGHEHNYERFTQMNANGNPVAQGLREIVAGTGGVNHHSFSTTFLPTSQVHNSTAFGVLKLTLNTGSYDWEFIPIAGKTFSDRGTTDCH